MSGLAQKSESLEQAGSAARRLLLPYTDPREPRILPYTGRWFWTLNTIESGHMRQKPFRLNQIEWVVGHITDYHDTYISQALFSQPCRQAVHVAWITHAWVDLDVYKLPVPLNPGMEGIMLRTFCRDEGIPEPSIIISSGRGLYAKWFWSSPVPGIAAGRCVAVNKELVRRFKAWGADPASTDMSRILRVVGTLNTKSGERARVLHQAECDGKPLTYHFDTFADDILKHTLGEVNGFRKAKADRAQVRILSHERAIREASAKAARVRVGNQRAFCREQWHWGNLVDIRKLIELRFKDGIVPVGWRDIFGHLACCQLARVVPLNRLWSEVQTLCQTFLPADYCDGPEFERHCQTLLRDAERAARGELDEWNGRKVTPIYTYRIETIIELLGITSAEMRHMTHLIDADEKRRRDREAWRASHTGLSREEYLETNSTSKDKPWDLEGISRCHWYRTRK